MYHQHLVLLDYTGPAVSKKEDFEKLKNTPPENRPIINQVYCVMLMGTGLHMMIADPLDVELVEIIRVIEERDDSTPVGGLYLKIADRIAASEEPSIDDVDMNDPEQAAIWKTVQILLNKVIYADSYLEQ